MRHVCNYVATLFGVGHIPLMPGTFGTIVAVAVYIILPEALFYDLDWLPYTGLALLMLSLIGVFVSSQAEKSYGHDAPVIVIDEFTGYFMAVMLLPRTLWMVIYSFVLFRVFDIGKPFPVNRSQNLPGGWGVMADDLLAGIGTNFLLQILIRIYPGFFGTGCSV